MITAVFDCHLYVHMHVCIYLGVLSPRHIKSNTYVAKKIFLQIQSVDREHDLHNYSYHIQPYK